MQMGYDTNGYTVRCLNEGHALSGSGASFVLRKEIVLFERFETALELYIKRNIFKLHSSCVLCRVCLYSSASTIGDSTV